MLERLAEHSSVQYGIKHAFSFGRSGYFLLGSGGFFVIALILTVLTKFLVGSSTVFQILILSSLLLAILSSTVFQVWTILRSLNSVLQPVASFLRSGKMRMGKDYQFSKELSKSPEPLIKYLGARLHMEAEHLRGRIGLLAGAIDKVGIIPLAGSLAFSLARFMKDADLRVTIYWEMGIAALGLLYILSIIMVAASHRIDELAQLTEFATEEAARESSRGHGQENGRTAS